MVNDKESCFYCKNQLICKHYAKLFDKLEFIQFMNDSQGFIKIMVKEIYKRCKFADKLEE